MIGASESKLAEGIVWKNLSGLYADVAVEQLEGVDHNTIRDSLLAYRMAHPIDTHPTLSERAAALKCDVDREIAHLFEPAESPAIAIFDNVDTVEEAATLVQHRVAVLSGRVTIPET